MTGPQKPDLDDVLEMFAAEPATDEATLAAYIRRYPQLAPDLADFAHELRLGQEAGDEKFPPDTAWQEQSWRQFASAAATAAAADPFAGVAPARLAEIRRVLDIPSAVLSGFRDRLVLTASVPRRFLERLAAALNTSLDQLEAFLALPPRISPAVSYKSNAAPGVGGEKITFEALLDQALVLPERRRVLLQEQD